MVTHFWASSNTKKQNKNTIWVCSFKLKKIIRLKLDLVHNFFFAFCHVISLSLTLFIFFIFPTFGYLVILSSSCASIVYWMNARPKFFQRAHWTVKFFHDHSLPTSMFYHVYILFPFPNFILYVCIFICDIHTGLWQWAFFWIVWKTRPIVLPARS